jgi:antitoxin component YwqK of YwqJK toxin-antitoxin module
MPFNRGFYILFILFSACQNGANEKSIVSFIWHRNSLEVDQDLVSVVSKTGLAMYNGEPFSGYTIEKYPNEQLKSRTAYERGKKHGLSQKWFENGVLSFETTLKNGKIHGSNKTWWKNGHIRSESHFEEGIPHGVQRQWYQSGALFKELHLAHGVEHGMQKSWRENGKIYNNYEAKDGRIFGLKRANLCYELEDENVQYRD